MADKSIELVDGLNSRPGTHGRRTYSQKAKRALVQMSKAPGVSVAGLAMTHGINANLLRRWISQHDVMESASSPEPRAFAVAGDDGASEGVDTRAGLPSKHRDRVRLRDGSSQRVRRSADLSAVLDQLAPRA